MENKFYKNESKHKLKTFVIGFPRIGEKRELKVATEKYFRSQITENELRDIAKELRRKQWLIERENGVDFITAGDFSFYDNMLDTAALLNCLPERYNRLDLTTSLKKYFAAARGYQGERGDVKALAMKKWFNTNYHYIVPEIDDDTRISVAGTKIFEEYAEAKAAGIETVPALIGGFTFLKLAKFTGTKTPSDFIEYTAAAYIEIVKRLIAQGAKSIRFDEPYLVTDITSDDIGLFEELYERILSVKGKCQIYLQTYFGDIRDCYERVTALDFDGIGLDFVEGDSLALLQKYGFPKTKTLFAGIISGKNIWRTRYKDVLALIGEINKYSNDIVIGASCSLLHVPYTVKNEPKLGDARTKYLAFAIEKLAELNELGTLYAEGDTASDYKKNEELFSAPRYKPNAAVAAEVAALKPADFVRLPEFSERRRIQKAVLGLPLLPTTTIGSFPQTEDVKHIRSAVKKGEISPEEYASFNKEKIARCIALQEEIGLDVLVHGEYERNDMVEYFGESLDGFIFTENAWVQSYGTRTVKPPIIWGDIKRAKPITVDYSVYAQSLTKKPLKGMLTGPITILNWSFPRADIPLSQTALQIALAIRGETLDLEKNGIKIIQIDEAALREKLPLRKSDWRIKYLDWAIPAFRLVHSAVKPETQIHTHMCYSEFGEIIKDIEAMDADVISFEASRSDLAILEAIEKSEFITEVGPGVYDIHSPRIPSVSELKAALNKILQKTDKTKLWVNPDCGLKTRGEFETAASLKHLVAAAKAIRASLQ